MNSFTSQIINFTYGDAYLESVTILFYLIFALPFISINRLINYSMIALDKSKKYICIIQFMFNFKHSH